MAQIITRIKDEKLEGAEDAFAGTFPIPLINVGTEEEPDMQPLCNKRKWLRKCLQRYIIKTEARWKKKQDNATIPYFEDEDIIEEDN